ncbi:phage baseplate assembly protein V [Streptomyces sp. CBMA29]|uniref:phage baseplate assembly protein V n=1 Tax=Streptomyces sp. CBMA29 TaxID=1896314 RepID=UPI00166212EA|nr:phage baseplate assembly protein V [Streptomyces sp. CBMA29]MBD0734070.1 hypothetical protein [Streptomyces sp. CBMA29]
MSQGLFYDAIVADTADPSGQGRARLRIPQVSGSAVTGWARPMQAGFVRSGDLVFAAFRGGDPNFPIFLPNLNPNPWAPVTLAAGWSGGTAPDGPPVCRLRMDGILEFDGLAVAASPPATGVAVPFASLPGGVPTPLYTGYQIGASNLVTAYGAQAVTAMQTDPGTTTSTAFTASLTGSTAGPVMNFVAPGTGQVIVTLGAQTSSSGSANSATMSARITQGATTVLAESADRALLSTGTARVSPFTAFAVTGLNPGTTYTATAMFRSDSAASTANFRSVLIAVEPVRPFSSPLARVSVAVDRTLNAVFPHGSAGTTVHLAGLTARIA